MDFLNQKEGGIVFPTFSFTETGFLSLKKYKSHGKAVELTMNMNNKEENS